jgi:hypothetical protein
LCIEVRVCMCVCARVCYAAAAAMGICVPTGEGVLRSVAHPPLTAHARTPACEHIYLYARIYVRICMLP